MPLKTNKKIFLTSSNIEMKGSVLCGNLEEKSQGLMQKLTREIYTICIDEEKHNFRQKNIKKKKSFQKYLRQHMKFYFSLIPKRCLEKLSSHYKRTSDNKPSAIQVLRLVASGIHQKFYYESFYPGRPTQNISYLNQSRKSLRLYRTL